MEETTKRPPESTDDHESRRKRAKDVREVAELTLTLAAMAEMRSGREPSGAEKAMMAEARARLAEICGFFSPREVFPVNAFGAVMEDLGLDMVREERELGYRPPAKLSIAEKVVYTKQKFEKSQANALRSATQISHGLQANTSAVADSRGALHPNKMFPSDTTKPAPVSSGVSHTVVSNNHTSAANSTSLPYQLPASDVRKPMISSGLPNSLPGKDSSPSLSRGERPPFRLDQRSNGSSYAPQTQANTPGGYTQPAWAQHMQSASSVKPGAHNKGLPQNTPMTTSRMASQAASPRPSMTQTTSGHQPTVVQTSLPNNTHSEISNVVQKFLQLHLPKRAAWNPPSRDYMNKSVTCQVCKLAIFEVENVLVCDACENGYHMKCLQTQDLKTIPRGEWHCFKCLALTDGKPLPPKYGRVTRNMTAPKAASLSSPSPVKRAGILGDKVNQQKLLANGSSGLQSSPASSMVNTDNSASNFNAPDARARQVSEVSPSSYDTNDQTHSGSYKNGNILKVAATPFCSSVEVSHEEKLGPGFKGETPSKPPETGTEVLYHMQNCSNGQDNDMKVAQGIDGVPTKLCNDSHLTVKNLENIEINKPHDGGDSGVVKEEKRVAHLELVENSDDGVGNHARSSSDDSTIVDWIGDVDEVADEKTYYSSCCVNGNVYKVQDHALFICNNRPMPSKIKTMWEDNKTRLKWVIVNRCYFPGDLPETVGHPCSLEGNEVYESNHGCTILADLIQGPCEVLHPEKFIQESERRSRLASEEMGGLRPLFQCKWFYDELKGSFRDLSILLQPDMVL